MERMVMKNFMGEIWGPSKLLYEYVERRRKQVQHGWQDYGKNDANDRFSQNNPVDIPRANLDIKALLYIIMLLEK